MRVELNFLAPHGVPFTGTVNFVIDEQIGEPHEAAVVLGECRDDGSGMDLLVLVNPDLPAGRLETIVGWLERRLSRRFNPDGSEPDAWQERSDGRVQILARAMDMPLLVTVDEVA